MEQLPSRSRLLGVSEQACDFAGYALNFAKMEASWGQDHCPAFFVATNAAAKQLLVCIRGTREVEDILADVTAFPVVSCLTACFVRFVPI